MMQQLPACYAQVALHQFRMPIQKRVGMTLATILPPDQSFCHQDTHSFSKLCLLTGRKGGILLCKGTHTFFYFLLILVTRCASFSDSSPLCGSHCCFADGGSGSLRLPDPPSA